MNLYNFIFIFYYFLVFNIFRININCFTCCLGEKNDEKYIEINLRNSSTKDKSIRLRKFLNNNKLNEKTNVNLIGNKDKDQSTGYNEQFEKEEEIVKKLENIFFKNNFLVNIDQIEIKDINDCCDILPKDLFVYYDGSEKIVISKDKSVLENYFKEHKKVVDFGELEFNGFTRFNLQNGSNSNFCLSVLKDELLRNRSSEITDFESILFIIFKIDDDDIISKDIKFDINIYYKKKDKKS